MYFLCVCRFAQNIYMSGWESCGQHHKTIYRVTLRSTLAAYFTGRTSDLSNRGNAFHQLPKPNPLAMFHASMSILLKP